MAVATLYSFSCNVSYEPAIRTTGVALVVALPPWLIGTAFSADQLSRQRWLVVGALVDLAAGIAIFLYCISRPAASSGLHRLPLIADARGSFRDTGPAERLWS